MVSNESGEQVDGNIMDNGIDDATKLEEPAGLQPGQGEYITGTFQPRVNASTRRNPFNDANNMISAGGIGTRTSTNSTSTPSHTPPTSEEITSALNTYERAFFPGQPKSLSGIALRAFLLGLSLAGSVALTTYLLYNANPLWRAPFFLASLSLFHFLEFYTTALTNSPGARVSSFLLSSNGSAYNIAHGTAFAELLLSHLFLPQSILPHPIHTLLLLTGLILITIGQSTRTLAMLHAGSNFSHIVSHTKKSSHELVTTGIYSILRHPSYFGFFWWGIGTQLVCGNVVCLVGYAVVLWRFFERRIGGEEKLLVNFFGDEYVQFRARTRVGIPFIN
ncbi:Isoprenylcysteine carboxyl methyltransferase family-domain-containing protein [Tricladium varicosporioides]|nr:Isoprenylcysteine carboxyl methyltransferase family-domain-containing protein [Hymenoscyphus varicosporioides]